MTNHLTNNENVFSKLLKLKNPVQINLADEEGMSQLTKIDTVDFIAFFRTSLISCTLNNVYYVPRRPQNLLCIKQIESNEFCVFLGNGTAEMIDESGSRIVEGKLYVNLYTIEFFNKTNIMILISEIKQKKRCTNWHCRMGHISNSKLQ